MAKNTSILLGEYFENFINEQVKSGKFSSASEVIRTALRLYEQQENETRILINDLKAGEKLEITKVFHPDRDIEDRLKD